MNVAITGLTACGKTFQSKMLADKLGFVYVSAASLLLNEIYGDLAKELDVNDRFWCKKKNIEFVSKMRQARDIDRKVDSVLLDMAKTKSGYVFDTRTLPWLYKGNDLIRIFLSASIEERVKISVSSKSSKEYSFEVLKKKILNKDKQDISGFKKLYGIEIDDPKNFDLVINNGELVPDETHRIIYDYFKTRL